MNYSIPVVVWLIIAAWGFVVSFRLVRRTRKDLKALEKRENGRRKLAWSRFIRESNRMVTSGLYFIAGLCALDILPWSFLIVPILIFGSFLVVVNSIVDSTTRESLFVTRDKEQTIEHT